MNRRKTSPNSHRRIALRLTLLTLAFVLLIGFDPGRCHAATNWTWIWSPDGTHPPETLYFRQRFRLQRKPLSVQLLITADDTFTAYLNEGRTPVGAGADWTTVQGIDVTRYVHEGDNLLCVQCRNTGGPGGLLYKLVIKDGGARPRIVFSDAKVRVNRHPPVVWTTFALNDANWPHAKEISPANGGVWGQLRGAPQPDPSHIVRQWNIRAGSPDADPYTRPRGVGERMLLSASVASSSELQILAGAGFTLFQTDSDHLSTEETAPNLWDWHTADRARALVQKLGLDWCYFEHEAFPPKWYRDSISFTRIQCLEHQQPVQAFSPWDPKWPAFIGRGYDALAKQFGLTPAGGNTNPQQQPAAGKSLLSAINVGVHGDYGEAGFLTGARVAVPDQRDDWVRRFGNAHDHLGFWCDDSQARADFRARMMEQYGTLEALNAAWHRAYQSPAEIDYPAQPMETPAGSDRQHYLDFIAWYRGSAGRALELNLRAARQRFPDTLLMAPAGFGDEDVRGGNDNSLIPKLAARYHAAVRSTHGAYKPFADNCASMLGRLGSASRFYGAPFWTEPPGSLTPNQTVERIFESVSQGAAGYFDWASNAVANREVYYRNSKYLRVERPVVDVAMFYPAQAQSLRPDQPYANTFERACSYLRDYGNFDIVDDRMVNDGCLANYRVLALWEGTACDRITLDKIKAWVDGGGVLLAYDFGKVADFNGDTSWFKELFGYVQDLAPARVSERYVGVVPPVYRIDIGQNAIADYLDGNWYEPEIVDADTVRWTGATATVRLPVDPDQNYAVAVQAMLPQELAGYKHDVLLNGRKIGEISTVGDVRYRFLIPDGALNGKSLATLTFQSEVPTAKSARQLGVRIQTITVIQVGAGDAQAQTAPLPPPGSIRRELDLSHLSATDATQSWVRRFGNGLTIYFPANRSLLKGYIEVIQRAMYHLSSIDPTRRNAINVDGSADGVYATLFTDKILYYNPKDTSVIKKVSVPATDFEMWKDIVLTPTETSWTVELKPHSIGAVYFGIPPQELLFECEQFLELGALKPRSAPDCSPGDGLTCVIVPKGAAITTHIKVEVAGKYNLYLRSIRNGKLEPMDVVMDNQPVAASNTKVGQTLFVATVNLSKGAHSLTLRAKPDRDVRADFVLLSNDPTISGYDFAVRTTPVD
jgi:hypothetical protein